MATKDTGVPCYDKAGTDEPIFVLRAQDCLAPAAVRRWAELAEMVGVDSGKVEEALKVAEAMEAWPNRRVPT